MDEHPSALLRLLPPEILFLVLVQLDDPIDLSSFSQACQATHSYCDRNDQLWKETFIRHFDAPSALDLPSFDYEQNSKQRIRARGLIRRADQGRQLRSIATGYESLLPTFNAIARQATSPTSLNTSFLTSLFPADSGFAPAYLSSMAKSDSVDEQDLAEFRLRWGLTPDNFALNRAIRSVYSLSHYTEANHYGPYLDDGRVDFKKAEQLRRVMADNLRDAVASEHWGETDDGVQVELPGDVGWEDTVQRPTRGRDWAGVEDGLIGSYLFCDWAIFEMINAENSPVIPPSHLRRQGVGECQRITLKLDPPTSTSADTYPRLDFAGTLSARDAASTPDYPSLDVKGFVEPVPGGGVRWSFAVIYSGQAQWRLEGFQAAPRCRLGIFGVWRGAAEGAIRDGPCGPFAFWTPLEENEES